MTYRVYLDYDDDRDVITCVTLSDTRPMARTEHTCGSSNKTIPVGARHRRRFMLVDGEPSHEKACRDWSTTEGQAAGGSRGDTPSATAGGSC